MDQIWSPRPNSQIVWRPLSCLRVKQQLFLQVSSVASSHYPGAVFLDVTSKLIRPSESSAQSGLCSAGCLVSHLSAFENAEPRDTKKPLLPFSTDGNDTPLFLFERRVEQYYCHIDFVYIIVEKSSIYPKITSVSNVYPCVERRTP